MWEICMTEKQHDEEDAMGRGEALSELPKNTWTVKWRKVGT